MAQIKFYTSRKTREAASPLFKTNTSDREGVRQVYLGWVFDRETVDILMASKKKVSSSYINEWFEFASYNKVSPVEPPIQFALAFLKSLLRQKKSFNRYAWQQVPFPIWVTCSKLSVWECLYCQEVHQMNIWRLFYIAHFSVPMKCFLGCFFVCVCVCVCVFLQYAANRSDRYTNIIFDSTSCYVGDTYLTRSTCPNHS